MEKSKESSDLGFQFFSSQFEIMCSIKDGEKSKVDLVLYKQIEGSCILKQYYQKDLVSIYKKLEQIHHPNLPIIYKVIYYKGDTYVLEERKEEREEEGEKVSCFTEEEVISIVNQLCQALSMLYDQNPHSIIQNK